MSGVLGTCDECASEFVGAPHSFIELTAEIERCGCADEDGKCRAALKEDLMNGQNRLTEEQIEELITNGSVVYHVMLCDSCLKQFEAGGAE